MHLTLLFLGEVDDRELPTLLQGRRRGVCGNSAICDDGRRCRLLSELAAAAGVVGRRRRWQAGSGCVARSAGAAAVGTLVCYRREDRQYTPHLTLGRVTGDGANGQADGGAGEEGRMAWWADRRA